MHPLAEEENNVQISTVMCREVDATCDIVSLVLLIPLRRADSGSASIIP